MWASSDLKRKTNGAGSKASSDGDAIASLQIVYLETGSLQDSARCERSRPSDCDRRPDIAGLTQPGRKYGLIATA